MHTIVWILTWLNFGLALGFSVLVVSRRKRAPSITLSWILGFFLLPYFGVTLYLLLGFWRFRRRLRPKPRPQLQHLGQVAHSTMVNDPDLKRVHQLAKELTSFAAVGGNSVELYDDAYRSYEALGEAIRHARHHVHLQYYIFQPDESGTYIRDLLIEKAKEGIECRLLVDQVGSFRVGESFIAPMRDVGVKFEFFWPLRLTRPWSFHLRNHRKIAVIDGRIGFIGSQNIGNEYLQWKNRGLSWRDTQLRIEGPAVVQLQTIFAEDWEFTTKEKLRTRAYFPQPEGRGEHFIQAFPTGPDENELSLEMVLLTMIHSAHDRIRMISPYFLPSPTVSLALEAATTRGVHVEILVPARSDHWWVDRAARSAYPELLKAGAHLYEYSKTFLHAKVVTVDDRVALLGSANMDERSYHVNFECSVLVYAREVLLKLNSSFEEMRMESEQLSHNRFENMGLWPRFRDGLFRILAPLL